MKTAAPLLQIGILSLAVAASSLVGCSDPSRPAAAPIVVPPKPEPPTRIAAFSVSNENLNVDKVGVRDGFTKPDGNRDLAFRATIEGPFDALFILSVDKKGEPAYGLRADTLVSGEVLPPELAGVIDTGKMTVGIGVVEGGQFINGDMGSAHGANAVHELALYVPNSGTLNPGSFLRLFVRTASGAIVRGPVVPY